MKKNTSFDDWITLQEAALIKGLSPAGAWWAARRGDVVARQRGRQWFVLRSSLDHYKPRDYPRTRKPLLEPSAATLQVPRPASHVPSQEPSPASA